MAERNVKTCTYCGLFATHVMTETEWKCEVCGHYYGEFKPKEEKKTQFVQTNRTKAD